MPIPQDVSILKSYFEAGDKPTHQNFEELIETIFALYQQAMDRADEALDLAGGSAGVSKAARVFGKIGTADPAANVWGFGIASANRISNVGVNPKRYRITFDTPFEDTNYTAIVSAMPGPEGQAVGIEPEIMVVNAAYIEVKYSANNYLALTIFKP